MVDVKRGRGMHVRVGHNTQKQKTGLLENAQSQRERQ